MPRTTRPSKPRHDIEEIAPNRFVLHNVQIAGLLKGEGDVEGRFFNLTTWRREGLIARLRQRSLKVWTLADQVAALPGLPPAPPLGAAGWRPLASSIDRYSRFDPLSLAWQPLAPEQRGPDAGVVVAAGSVLRRRKGRGPSSYHLAHLEHGGTLALSPLDETEALLAGYAQAGARGQPTISASAQGDRLALPELELPPPYRRVLARLLEPGEGGPSLARRNLPLVAALFERLGVALQV